MSETVAACRVGIGTVQKVRKELIVLGLVPPFPNTRQRFLPGHDPTTDPPPVLKKLKVTSTEELLGDDTEIEDLLTGQAPLTREQRRAKLDLLFQHGGPDHMIRADKALRDMEKEEGSRNELGPIPPQTLEDGIMQVADMIEALQSWGGESAVKEAVTRGMENFLLAQQNLQPTITAQPNLTGPQD